MPLLVLGPQHPSPNVSEALPGDGPVAAITAGWRYDEGDTEALAAALGREVVSIPLYRWFEQVQAGDAGLGKAYRARQRRIRDHKELYRIRLLAGLQAVHALQARVAEDPELVLPELDRAVEAVRRLDEEVVEQLDAIREAFPEVAAPWDMPAARAVHERAEALLDGVDTVCVAGGNVAVLRNRMEFFGTGVLLERFLARGGTLACWSAGAMALASTIVVFYDDPPEGPSEAEVLDAGLGLLPDVTLFPHARRRLRLGDAVRVARLARRFAPSPCIALENGAWIEPLHGRWVSRGLPGTASRFGLDGSVASVGAE